MSLKRRPAPRHAAAVSDQLRAVISSRALVPYALALAADVAPSVLSRYLSGERGLSMDSFDRLASALGLRLVEGPRRGKPAPKVPAAVLSKDADGPL